MNPIRTFLLTFLLIFTIQAGGLAQKGPKIDRVDPPSWFTGMQSGKVELMIHGENLGKCKVEVDYPGIIVESVYHPENEHYVFVSLVIDATAMPGEISMKISGQNGKPVLLPYQIKPRNQEKGRIQGVTSEDLIYLAMPDRFSNGDKRNDVIKNTRETELNRNEMFKRHGGDIAGISNRVDYLKELGITALWLNPVLENDNPQASYHGYAITDHYKIDPRFGTMEEYQQLEQKCRESDIKMVMDVVYNHTGIDHYFIADLPENDWIHQWDEFTRTTYRAPTLLDPYASEHDQKLMKNGWFDKHMPDLNQQNPRVANYLIQNTLWWIEMCGIDGLRIDTYAYSDLTFMANAVKRVRQEYPALSIFGETWVHGTPIQAFFTERNGLNTDFNTRLPGVTDFQLHYAINDALNQPFGWTEGVARLYYTLAKDVIYNDPTQNVVFLDNHDLSRFYSVVGEDFDKFKMGVGFLMTTRGIPMIYYGTEILMKNFADPDGKVREDFPGGWDGDEADKFTAEGRTAKENEAFEYVKTLANYRKTHPVLKSGKLMQFVPENGVYIYFRYNDAGTVMVVMNQNDAAHSLSMGRFQERTQGFRTAKDIVSGNSKPLIDVMEIPAKTTLILELNR